MNSERYGVTEDGKPVVAYTLANTAGMRVCVLSLGCIIAHLEVPDREGNSANVVLGSDSVAGYLHSSPHFGAIAGRYANRIAGGRFAIDGIDYQLDTNAPPNTLHGGRHGFDKVIWQAENHDGEALVLRYLSPDGEAGYAVGANGLILNTVDGAQSFVSAVSPVSTDLTSVEYYR